MRTLNLGILAHVDAGKTTLTERLLYAAGAIDSIGSVDAGTTQTDSLELERERGITIRSAVASFAIGDLAVNIVDTPGHPDFIAEVERVLGVLDGAILVVSAVEGVQPQTPLLFRALRRIGVPTLIFVNKIDRAGADPERVLAALRRRLAPTMVPLTNVRDAGTPAATVTPRSWESASERLEITELLAEADEAVLGEYVALDAPLPASRLRAVLADHTRRGLAFPVFYGSAARGIGTELLTAGLDELLAPAPDRAGTEPSAAPPLAGADTEVAGRIFKIERSSSGERVAFVRVDAGTLAPRRRIRVAGVEAKASSVATFAPGNGPRRSVAVAGEMARVLGLGAVRVGDPIGDPSSAGIEAQFALPTLESVVVARRPEQGGSLRAALNQLAEQDPLINVRQNDERRELLVSLYGEVQKEVIQATLERDYGIAADFRETTTLCIEWPAKAAEADEVIRAKTKTNIMGRSSPLSENPFLATMGLRVEPLPLGSGIEFRIDVEPRLLPIWLYKTHEAVAAQFEAYVREALAEGASGWQVTDCRVTLWDCGYASPVTSHQDYRRLTQLVLAEALDRAGTWVCEPLAAIMLELPSLSASGALALMSRIGGRVTGQFSARGVSTINAVIPVAHVRDLQHALPGLTGGEGVLEQRFGGYQPVGTNPPTRARSTPSPLQRDEWLAWLARRG